MSDGPGPKMQLVELYRRDTDLSVEEFWWLCFELGGMNTLLQLDELPARICRSNSQRNTILWPSP